MARHRSDRRAVPLAALSDSPLARGTIAAAAVLSLAITVGYGLSGDPQWSFAARCDNRDTVTFYYAAKAALAGLDPYDNPLLLKTYGAFVWWVYPPSGVPFFAGLTLLPFSQAVLAFNVVKAMALLGLLVCWGRLLPTVRRDGAFWLFAAAALNGTLLQDWCSGNIAIFEALAIWLALGALWRGRVATAAALILLLGLLKPTWLVLLLLLAHERPINAGPGRKAMLISALGAAALFALWLALDFSSFGGWLHNARSTLSIRYNAFELVKDLRLALGGGLDVPLWQRVEYPLYALWCLAVGALLWRAWRGADRRGFACLLLLGFAAANPANLSYSWVFVLPLVYSSALEARPVAGAIIVLLALLPGPLLGVALPVRDVGMVALLAAMLGFVSRATQTPQARLSLQTID